MSSLNNNNTRYQNPEVFEQLAIEYAVGSMQGRAKKRFETLMETHFYLQAVVDAYESKFATLVELLPDSQPSNQVWKNIDAHVQASTNKQKVKTPWWQSNFFKQGFGMAAMALIVSAVLLLNPMTVTPTSYAAVLKSDSNTAMAITKIEKSDMTLTVDIMKVKVADNMELTLWCHPKDGGMPMKMGTISKTGETKIKISKKEWQNMKDVGLLAISVEHKDSNTSIKPTGRILLKGQLNTAAL